MNTKKLTIKISEHQHDVFTDMCAHNKCSQQEMLEILMTSYREHNRPGLASVPTGLGTGVVA